MPETTGLVEIVAVVAAVVERTGMTAESEKSGWRDGRDQDPSSEDTNSHKRGTRLAQEITRFAKKKNPQIIEGNKTII